MTTTPTTIDHPAGEAVKAFSEYLVGHTLACNGMDGHAIDDMALDLARIALDFQASAPGRLHQIAEPVHKQDDSLRMLMLYAYTFIRAALQAAPPAPAAVAAPDFDVWRKREYPWLGPIGDGVQMARDAWNAALAAAPAQEHATQLAGGAQAGHKLGRATVKSGRVQSYAFEQSDAPDGEHCLFSAAPAQAQDVQQDSIRELIAQHAAELERNEYAYFELCYHRSTGWMAWITDKPLCMPAVANPDRKVLARGGGDTAEEACADAIDAARAAQGGA